MRYPVSNFTSVCFYMYTYPQPPTGPRPHPPFVTRIAPMGVGIEAKPLKTLLLGTDVTSICVKIGVFFVVFSQQCRLFATGMHKHHTHSWGVTFLPHPLAHIHTGAHTHTHAQAQARTPRRKRVHPGAAAQARSFPPRKAKNESAKTNHPANHPESG